MATHFWFIVFGNGYWAKAPAWIDFTDQIDGKKKFKMRVYPTKTMKSAYGIKDEQIKADGYIDKVYDQIYKSYINPKNSTLILSCDFNNKPEGFIESLPQKWKVEAELATQELNTYKKTVARLQSDLKKILAHPDFFDETLTRRLESWSKLLSIPSPQNEQPGDESSL